MSDKFESLKIRILVSFITLSKESCTVTGLARLLGTEKYSISRAISALEKEGLLTRGGNRTMGLTGKGNEEARRYAGLLEAAQSCLLDEGVPPSDARQDAMAVVQGCSDSLLSRIQELGEKRRIRQELGMRKAMTGAAFCRKLRDGSYMLPFAVYSGKTRGGELFSAMDAGFEHPCELHVTGGTGHLYLKSVPMHIKPPGGDRRMQGKVVSVYYFDGEAYNEAGKSGDFFYFPAGEMRMVSVGGGKEQLLHGSISLKLSCSAAGVQIPEEQVVMAVFFG